MKHTYKKKMANGGPVASGPIPSGPVASRPISSRPVASTTGSAGSPMSRNPGAPMSRNPAGPTSRNPAGPMSRNPGAPMGRMADGGKVDKDKGYTQKDLKSLKRLIEDMLDPYAGDVTGGSSVTAVEKGKKMARGGIVGKPARSARDMKAGAGSGVGRMQKTKIQRGR